MNFPKTRSKAIGERGIMPDHGNGSGWPYCMLAWKKGGWKKLAKPVMIRRYRDLPDASIAKSVLDSAGIESILVDENIVRLDWLWSNLVGGIKLLVREEDADTANRLLNQNVLEKFNVEGVGEYEQPRCPRCESLDVAFGELDKRIAYGGMFVGLPIPIRNKGWKCHACGHEWKDDNVTQTSVPGPAQPH